MIKIISLFASRLQVSPVINRPFLWEMGNLTSLQQKSKKLGLCHSSFKSKNFWINSMCEYIFRKDWIFYSYSALSAMGKYLVESLLLQIVETRDDDHNNAAYIMIKL